jgi:hypothetical protein
MGDSQLFWYFIAAAFAAFDLFRPGGRFKALPMGASWLTITLDAGFDDGFGAGFWSSSEPSSKSASRSSPAGSSSIAGKYSLSSSTPQQAIGWNYGICCKYSTQPANRKGFLVTNL